MSHTNELRRVASPGDGTGGDRWAILKAGANQASRAFNADFHLEAIVLTEGMLWCRIASRFQYITENDAPEWLSVTKLIDGIAKGRQEHDTAEFAALFGRTKSWLKEYRNPLAHAAAKLLDKNGLSFAEKMANARKGAETGFRILVDLETLDMKSRLANGWIVGDPASQRRPPASYPDAFDSIRALLKKPTAAEVLANLQKQLAEPAARR